MKRGVSFLLQNMTMLTDNYNVLRPVDKQRREEKGKQSPQNNLLPSPILAAFSIFPLIWSSAKNFSCSAVTAGLFNRTEIEPGRRSRVIFRIRSRNLFAFFNISWPGTFLPYNVKAGVDQVFARNFLAWFR